MKITNRKFSSVLALSTAICLSVQSPGAWASTPLEILSVTKLVEVDPTIGGDGGNAGHGGAHAVLNDHLYVALSSDFNGECQNDTMGVAILDISDPETPSVVGHLPVNPQTRVSGRMVVKHIETPHFSGDILAFSAGQCQLYNPDSQDGKVNPNQNFLRKARGLHLWDVTDPKKPKLLIKHYQADKDSTGGGTHIYQDGDKAYVMLNMSSLYAQQVADIGIIDITKPQSPRFVNRFGFFTEMWPATVEGTQKFPAYDSAEVRIVELCTRLCAKADWLMT